MTKINVDLIYPIGSIYMSVNSTNPSNYFGGTWQQWGSGRVPVGIDTSQTEFNTAEKTGGEKNVTLTVAKIPKHTHELKRNSGYPLVSTAYSGETGWGVTSLNAVVDGGVVVDTSLSETGGGEPHNNLQPYITCYMWKRTA